MTNKLYVGFTKTVEVPEMRLSGHSVRRCGLLIDDEVRQIPRAKIFDPLYERVDKLPRELENPNLHDIRNMSFRVELWDRHALHRRSRAFWK
jgi:hypothetical protein